MVVLRRNEYLHGGERRLVILRVRPCNQVCSCTKMLFVNRMNTLVHTGIHANNFISIHLLSVIFSVLV